MVKKILLRISPIKIYLFKIKFRVGRFNLMLIKYIAMKINPDEIRLKIILTCKYLVFLTLTKDFLIFELLIITNL